MYREMVSTVLLVVVSLMCCVRCDFDCLCNYHVERSVVGSDLSTVIGYMYEFDCKPTVADETTGDTWVAVAFEHQIGYINRDSQTQIQTCPGNPSEEDILTTTMALTNSQSTTTTRTTASTTQMPTTAVHTPDTTTTATSTTDLTSVQFTTTSSTTMPTSTTKAATTSTEHTPSSTTRTTIQTTVPSTPPPQTTSTTQITTTPRPTVSSTTALPSTTETTMTTTKTSPTTATTMKPTTNSTTSKPTTTINSSTTVKQTQSTATSPSNVISGNIDLCPSHIRYNSQRGILGQYGHWCYELITNDRYTWLHGEQMCSKGGGHLAYISNVQEQNFIQAFLTRHNPTHAVWIGLNDQNTEGRLEWTSGNAVQYTNWIPGHSDNFLSHNEEDCVVFVPYKNGVWDDISCGISSTVGDVGNSYAILCQYSTTESTPAPVTISPVIQTDGNIHLCPTSVLYNSQNGILGQYDRGCYELITNDKYTWLHGEQMCSRGGGHLAHISNIQEQNFIQHFLTRHNPTHAVWIGLNDQNTEGRLEWTSGNAVQYTNWIPGHSENFASHDEEDCVVFVPYKNGVWDDISCGTSSSFGDVGNAYAILCQYKISANSGGIIVGR